MIYTVYASQADEVQKKLDRLAKKAKRYEIPFSYTRSEEHPEKVTVYAVDPADGYTQYEVESYMVSAIDFDVDCESFIKADGWTVLARIEHGDVGNIVDTFKCDADPDWFHIPSRCDHCNTNRFRSVTFIVEKDGVRKQVGKSCLKDYTGINPSIAAMWAEVTDLFPGMDCDEREWHERGMKPMREIEEILAHAYDSIKKHGYVKKDMQNSTRDDIRGRLSEHVDPSPEAKAKAKEIREWLIERGKFAKTYWEELHALEEEAFEIVEDEYGYRGCEIRDEAARQKYLNKCRAWNRPEDLEQRCAALAISGYAKDSHIGKLAYMPIAYKKYLEKKAVADEREAKRIASAEASQHVGEIGKRITITTVKAELITSWETKYGYTHLYKFVDASGNVFVWFASSCIECKDGMKIKGTVKDHTERDGIKQTVLSRCSVIAD